MRWFTLKEKVIKDLRKEALIGRLVAYNEMANFYKDKRENN